MHSCQNEVSLSINAEGNWAIHDHIALALERCQRNPGKGITLEFPCCNLNNGAVNRLAEAVERSTCLRGIDYRHNPGKNDHTDEAMRQAIIATESPITMWNGHALSDGIMQARRARQARE